ncbi:MAG: rubrerythrin family protein [Fervidicoccaceae archaeon]
MTTRASSLRSREVQEALLSAFAGESMAQSRYRAYAEVARREGYVNLARIFEGIAFAEQIHARNHLGASEQTSYPQRACAGTPTRLGTSSSNLELAIAGELYEVNTMYPSFIGLARERGDEEAARTFSLALEAERVHASIYKWAKEHVDRGQDVPLEGVWICEGCGHTHLGRTPPAKCPLCGSERYLSF